jgi:hypothetical protein
MLFYTTLIANYIALAAAIWLGLYIVTNNHRNPISWLTGLTLWSLSGVFLNILLALTPPPIPEKLPTLLSLFLPFWQTANMNINPTVWLQGWSVTPAAMFWHHATILFRPGETNLWRSLRVLFGYLVAAAGIIAQSRAVFLVTSTDNNPLYLSSLGAGPGFAVFFAFLLIFMTLSLINLGRSIKASLSQFQRKQLITLFVATVIAGLSGPTMILSSGFGVKLPIITQTFLLGIAVLLIGYSVEKYSSLTDERVIRRDFKYNALSVGLMILLYFAITWFGTQFFGTSKSTYIIMMILAIATHTAVDISRRYLDMLFYTREVLQLRDDLTQLAKFATDRQVNNRLNLALDSICSFVCATYGVLIEIRTEQAKAAAKFNWNDAEIPNDAQIYRADDILPLETGQIPDPFSKAALLVPLYHEDNQIGALILGRPINGVRYAQTDINRILYPGDQLAEWLWQEQQTGKYISQMSGLMSQARQRTLFSIEHLSTKNVEDALRKMADYTYLGNHPLANMELIHQKLPIDTHTHIERGKALNEVLKMAIEKLRPGEEFPKDPPPREWYAYYILRDAYIDEIPNRDIMLRLYISEGTFNRTRRSAVRAVTQAIKEMEAGLF